MNNILFLVPTAKEEVLKKYYLKKKEGISYKGTKLYIDPRKKKTSVSDMKKYIANVLPQVLNRFKANILVICDAGYFKTLCKKSKAEPYIGYACESTLGIPAFYCPSPDSIFYNPEKVSKVISHVMKQVINYCEGIYKEPGSTIDFSKSKFYKYDQTEDIKKALLEYFNEPVLTCDIETFDLKHYRAGIASITFCKNQNEGIAFQVDEDAFLENKIVRKYLKEFFTNYKGKLIFHNIAFDAYVLVYQLWMKKLTDTEGLLEGLDIMLKNWDDTKLITYLATNSCSGNNLHLKYLSQEFAGNYAQEEIDNIAAIPIDDLLKYNLTDGLSTWFVYNKYYQKMIDDNQLDIYEKIFKPATKDIIQMQLTGLPIDPKQLEYVIYLLKEDEKKALDKINSSPYVKLFLDSAKEEYVDKKNKTLKTKKITIEDVKDLEFNINSPQQLSKLLYKTLELPIIEYTNTKQPSTSSDTIEALLNHTNSEPVKELLQALLDYSSVAKINTAFIPTFKAAPLEDGTKWLFGGFNLGGTVSGRLSSSKPNLNVTMLQGLYGRNSISKIS